MKKDVKVSGQYLAINTKEKRVFRLEIEKILEILDYLDQHGYTLISEFLNIRY